MFSTVLNPKFASLQAFVSSLPSIFSTEGMCIYQGRNQIKVFVVDGVSINVKAFHIPIFINQIAYSFLRKTKARRAYEYALEVRRRGFETPEPIAYIEQRTFGLLKQTFFVSLQCDMPGIMRTFLDADVSNEGKLDLIEAFARYTARLHEAGILHVDYSPGNILFQQTPQGYQFSLVDINRMRFGAVDRETGCANFARLCGNSQFFELVAKFYAQERHFNQEECLRLIFKYRDLDRNKRKQWWRIIK